MMRSLGLPADTDAGYARLAQAAAPEIVPNHDAEPAEAGAAGRFKIQDEVAREAACGSAIAAPMPMV